MMFVKIISLFHLQPVYPRYSGISRSPVPRIMLDGGSTVWREVLYPDSFSSWPLFHMNNGLHPDNNIRTSSNKVDPIPGKGWIYFQTKEEAYVVLSGSPGPP